MSLDRPRVHPRNREGWARRFAFVTGLLACAALWPDAELSAAIPPSPPSTARRRPVPRADLEITQHRAAIHELKSGKKMVPYFEVYVTNAGNTAFTGLDVECTGTTGKWVSTPQALTVEPNTFGFWVKVYAPMGYKEIALGEHSLECVGKMTDTTVSELDTSNNRYTAKVKRLALPDLRAYSGEFGRCPTGPSNSACVTFKVFAAHEAEVGGSWRIQCSGIPGGPKYLPGESVPKASTKEITVDLGTLPEGRYSITCEVDGDHTIDERNETNNHVFLPNQAISACGEQDITAKIKQKIHHHLLGKAAPPAGPVVVTYGGNILVTPGRVRILGRIHFRFKDGEFYDTFDDTVYEASKKAPSGCTIESVQFHGKKTFWGSMTAHEFSGSTTLNADGPLGQSKDKSMSGGSCNPVWVPGNPAGKVGCTLEFPMTIRLFPYKPTSCDHPKGMMLSGRSRTWGDLPMTIKSGDAAFVGNVDASLSAEWVKLGDVVLLRSKGTLQETGGDRSKAAGSTQLQVFEVSRDFPGCALDSIEGDTKFRAVQSNINAAREFSVKETTPNVQWLDNTAAWCTVIPHPRCYDLTWVMTRDLKVHLKQKSGS